MARLPPEQLPASVGGTVPPLLRGTYRGEVEVHVPAFGARSSHIGGTAREVAVRVLWWGMPAGGEAAPELHATKLRQRALPGLSSTHASSLNTVWHPVVVQREALHRYLSQMVRAANGSAVTTAPAQPGRVWSVP